MLKHVRIEKEEGSQRAVFIPFPRTFLGEPEKAFPEGLRGHGFTERYHAILEVHTTFSCTPDEFVPAAKNAGRMLRREVFGDLLESLDVMQAAAHGHGMKEVQRLIAELREKCT